MSAIIAPVNSLSRARSILPYLGVHVAGNLWRLFGLSFDGGKALLSMHSSQFGILYIYVYIDIYVYICIDYKEISKLIGHISLPNCRAINLRIEKIGICLYRYRFRNLGAIFQTVSFPTPSGRPKRRALITLFPAIDRLWTCFHRDNLAPCHAPCHSTMLSLT